MTDLTFSRPHHLIKGKFALSDVKFSFVRRTLQMGLAPSALKFSFNAPQLRFTASERPAIKFGASVPKINFDVGFACTGSGGGVPSGGLEGEVLAKRSGMEKDVYWADPATLVTGDYVTRAELADANENILINSGYF